MLACMNDVRRPQNPAVGEAAVDLVVPLLKASLDPASQRAGRPIDSPAGKIVSQILRRDLDTGGLDGVIELSASLAFTLSYLIPPLAEAHGRDPEEMVHALAEGLRERGHVSMARVMDKILTPDVAEVLMDVFAQDEVDFYNVLLELADCTATHAQAIAHVWGTPLDDEFWAEIDAGLRE
jgi:hypothetical protein